MSDDQHAYWLSYLRRLADLLGLRDWRFVLQSEPPENDAVVAEIAVIRGRRIAMIRLSPDWSERKPDEQRNACVHELVHCYIEPVLIGVEAAAEVMNRAAFRVLYHQVDMLSEYAIDGIAMAIAPLLPLPEASE